MNLNMYSSEQRELTRASELFLLSIAVSSRLRNTFKRLLRGLGCVLEIIIVKLEHGDRNNDIRAF